MSFSFECIGCGRVHGNVSEKLDGKKIRCECGMLTRVYFKTEPTEVPQLEPLKRPLPLLPPEPKEKPKRKKRKSSKKTVVLPSHPSVAEVPSFQPLPRVQPTKPRRVLVTTPALPSRHNLTAGLAMICGFSTAIFGIFAIVMSMRPMSGLNEQIREIPQAWGLTANVIILVIAAVLGFCMSIGGVMQMIHAVNELVLRKNGRGWPDFIVFALGGGFLLLSIVAIALGAFTPEILQKNFSYSAGLDAYYLRKSLEAYSRSGPILFVSFICIMLVSFLRMYDRSTTNNQLLAGSRDALG